jgi:hypothetical protein
MFFDYPVGPAAYVFNDQAGRRHVIWFEPEMVNYEYASYARPFDKIIIEGRILQAQQWHPNQDFPTPEEQEITQRKELEP